MRPRRMGGILHFVRRWGGVKPTVGLIVVIIVVASAVLAPLVAPYPPAEANLSNVRQPPSWEHWFGTDTLGRDVFSRVIWGGRISLLAGVIPVLIGVSIGGALGLIGGYFGGKSEHVIMRLADALLAFPPLVLTLALVYALGPNFQNALIAIGIAMIPEYIRVVRGQVLSLREFEFVSAAVAVGAGNCRIISRHIAPNLVAAVLVLATIQAGRAILIEAGLSYLGLGVQPPKASWGSMVQTGYPYLNQAPWMCVFPGIAIMITVLALNFVGDGLRDALDPRLRGAK